MSMYIRVPLERQEVAKKPGFMANAKGVFLEAENTVGSLSRAQSVALVGSLVAAAGSVAYCFYGLIRHDNAAAANGLEAAAASMVVASGILAFKTLQRRNQDRK